MKKKGERKVPSQSMKQTYKNFPLDFIVKNKKKKRLKTSKRFCFKQQKKLVYYNITCMYMLNVITCFGNSFLKNKFFLEKLKIYRITPKEHGIWNQQEGLVLLYCSFLFNFLFFRLSSVLGLFLFFSFSFILIIYLIFF